MANQFTTIGNVYSIDLDRFVSAWVQELGKKGAMLIVRQRGSGFLRFLKYSNYRVLYAKISEAQKDMEHLLDAANKWKTSKKDIVKTEFTPKRLWEH